MNFHDIEITVYKGVRDTIGHRSTLFKFLENVEYDAIHELRSTTDANRKTHIKLSLPQATISGVFAPTRSAENLVKHSGLICVDIDRKDNLHIANFDTLIPDVLSHIEEVAYASTDFNEGALNTTNMKDRFVDISTISENGQTVLLVNTDSRIVKKDVEVENGYIHAVDKKEAEVALDDKHLNLPKAKAMSV